MGQAVLLVAGRAYKKRQRTMEEQIAYLSHKYGAVIYPIHCPQMDVSSEGIRSAEPVEEYIRSHGLYTHPVQ